MSKELIPVESEALGWRVEGRSLKVIYKTSWYEIDITKNKDPIEDAVTT